MEIFLDEIIKSINSEINNKSPGNDGLTPKFYKDFSNELAPVLLDIYDSWRKLGTVGVTSITGTISVTDPYTILKNRLQKSFRYYNS